MNQINTIIFDLGGVLVDWNPRYLYRKLFETEEEIDYFLDNIATNDWNEGQDAGRSLKDGTELLLSNYPEEKWREAIKAYYGRWPEMLGGAIDDSVQILKHYTNSADFQVYALTNWSAETWPIALREFDFLHWFEDVLVSGEEGMRKPTPEFYQLMMDRYNLKKSHCVFIDDNERNVIAARAFGIKSIHFQNDGSLSEGLATVVEK